MMTSFWGAPTCEPRNKDVARLVEYLRELTKRTGKGHTLRVATSSIKAIVTYVATEHGPREALAIIDAIRAETKGLTS